IRRQPAEEARLRDAIAHDFEPQDLSAPLMAESADRLLAAGDTARAEKFYRALQAMYPRGDVVDFAYAGLGEIALRNGDAQGALILFDEAIDKGVAGQKLRELTLGRSMALLSLGRLDDARKGFEQVASVREWRGEATAQAVYSLGEIEFKQGRWAEANAVFQRVFVAYQKFLPWVAKSYLASADCLEKLGKPADAIRTYQEMLRNQKLAALPETATARERLKILQEKQG
ncbi:MAG: tetratricopeptide repeat protein, partial [Verrucomicrobiota bacterium]